MTKRRTSSPWEPASLRQMAYMEAHGLYYPPRCTKGQATEIITEFQEDHDPADDQHPHDIEDSQ